MSVEKSGSEAGERIAVRLEAMVSRFRQLARPDDLALASRLRTLAPGKDRIGFEETRIGTGRSVAEAVALIIVAGDGIAASVS